MLYSQADHKQTSITEMEIAVNRHKNAGMIGSSTKCYDYLLTIFVDIGITKHQSI